MPVLELKTGKTLKYCQLRRHPKYQLKWNKSYCNELSRLCQGIGTDLSGTGLFIKGTDTFFIINYMEIPTDHLKEVTCTKVLCEIKLHKDYPNRTHITISRNHILYPGNVGTPTGSHEISKIVLNSVVSCCNARYASFNISNFYLCTPLDRYKYSCERLSNTLNEFFQE